MSGRGVLAIITLFAVHGAVNVSSRSAAAQNLDYTGANRIYASFDLSRPQGGPFPSDIFTVEDATQMTGRRINYPLPDCAVRPTDCDDLEMVNMLDGWGLQPRISIPFTGDVDPTTLNSDTVFVLDLADGKRIGINQPIWDPPTHTLHAESDKVLDQYHRYAVIVTNGVRDTSGKAVKATSNFESMNAHNAPVWYQTRLREIFDVARAQGLVHSDIVAASAFTTQSITSVMELIRDSIVASHPPAADFKLGPNGERTVFAKTQVASATWLRHTQVSPTVLSSQAINLAPLDIVPGVVGTIAYGRYQSPDYMVHPDQYIPDAGTLSAPPLQQVNTVYFTLFLPAGPKPPNGWPIVILSGGSSTNKHSPSVSWAAKFAEHGLATIAINHVGQGFGPLTQLRINKTDVTSITFPDAGRGVDQDGDNNIGNIKLNPPITIEGDRAGGKRAWTIRERDAFRQTIIDFMQLIRVIEIGMDVDGNGAADIDQSRIYFVGLSQGSMLGTLLLPLEPSIRAGVLAFTTGVIPEHLRWQVMRRNEIGDALQKRIPSLLNEAYGLTSIDGVPVASSPYFNENKPLRDKPIVINEVPGALEIQQALEFSEMVSESGLSPALWSRYVRLALFPGMPAKSVMYLFAKGDRTAVNPGTTLLLRAGNLADRTIYFRTDLAVAQDPGFPKEPHAFLVQVLSMDPLLKTVARNAQDWIGLFFQSDGTATSQPVPTDLFEMPIVGPLPETLNYIP